MSTDDESILSKLARRRAFWIAVPVVMVVDQLLKGLAQHTLKPEGWQPGDPAPYYEWINGVVHGTWSLGSINSVASENTALSVGSGLVSVVFWLAVFYFVALRSQPKQWILRLGGGLLLGGIASNFIDIALFGSVRNFLIFGFDNPFSFTDREGLMTDGIYAKRPMFSTAAIAIVVGIALLLVGAFVGKKKPPGSPPPPPPKTQANLKQPGNKKKLTLPAKRPPPA